MPRASRWNDFAAAALPRLRAAAVPFVLGVVFGFGFLPRFHVLDAIASVFSDFQERRREDLIVHPHVDHAALDSLTYEQVAAEPSAALGKTVVWCIDHTGSLSYADARPSHPLRWTNESLVPTNSPTSGGRCTKVAAVVEAVKPDGVLLTFKGLP